MIVSFAKKSRSTEMLERHCMELLMKQVLPGVCSPVAPVCGGQPVVATSSPPVQPVETEEHEATASGKEPSSLASSSRTALCA